MEHWDVSTAFIHAPLKEKVFMKQATGHEEKGKEEWVYLLVKALYGTKQAAHAWQQHLKTLLLSAGFAPLLLDPAKRKERVCPSWHTCRRSFCVIKCGREDYEDKFMGTFIKQTQDKDLGRSTLDVADVDRARC